MFPNQQLGNERDMIEGMQLGTIDLAVINTPLLAGFDPRFLIFDMPFLFNDWAHVSKLLSSPIGADLLSHSRAGSSRLSRSPPPVSATSSTTSARSRSPKIWPGSRSVHSTTRSMSPS